MLLAAHAPIAFRNCISQNQPGECLTQTDRREVLESQAPITSCVCALPIENVKTEDKGEEQKVNCKEKIKKAFRLDTYTIGAALRNLHRIRWTLNEAPKGIRAVLSVYFDRELRNQLQARNQNLKIDQLLSQIDIQELGGLRRRTRVESNLSGQSIWTLGNG